MFRIGLTGGIAAGKSAASNRFRELGIVVIDHDLLARQAVEPRSSGLARIVQTFGPQVLTQTGELDRASLGKIVFGDQSLLMKLNAITHPEILALSAAAEQAAVTTDHNAIVVHDIPLLIETGQEHDFDELVVVIADEKTRLDRLTSGRGMDPAEAQKRIASQTTDKLRRQYATVVMNGGGTLEQLNTQVDSFVAQLRTKLDLTG